MILVYHFGMKVMYFLRNGVKCVKKSETKMIFRQKIMFFCSGLTECASECHLPCTLVCSMLFWSFWYQILLCGLNSNVSRGNKIICKISIIHRTGKTRKSAIEWLRTLLQGDNRLFHMPIGSLYVRK